MHGSRALILNVACLELGMREQGQYGPNHPGEGMQRWISQEAQLRLVWSPEDEVEKTDCWGSDFRVS